MVFNAISLLIALMIIAGLVIFASYTFMIHRHNCLIRKKIGKAAYDELTASAGNEKSKRELLRILLRLLRNIRFSELRMPAGKAGFRINKEKTEMI